MVNNKPFFVQKWDIHVCLDKREPSHIPIWVRLCNIPMEAWTTSGISALASRLGKLLVMDALTAEICKKGVGKVKYARVLVEVSATKDVPNEIEVVYKGKDVNHGKNKAVNTEEPSKKNDNGNNEELNDGFTKVRYRKEYGVSKKKQDKTNVQYQKKSEKLRVDTTAGNPDVIMESLKRSANKYAVLDEHGCDNPQEEMDGSQSKLEPGEINDVLADENRIAQGMEEDKIMGSNKGVGNERNDLWKELNVYKRIVFEKSWVIMGDMNVTLEPSEHTVGSSSMSKDMLEFKNCVNSIEMEDIASSGLFYTWTKNLHKTKQGDTTGILKKLDRAMRNEAFVCEYPNAHAIFLPYLILDHCPMVLVIPNTMQGRRKAFRFSNFVAEKEEFLEIVKDIWNANHRGCQMFKITRKLKALKKPLKDLAWKNGDLFKNVNDLRDKLKEIQKQIDIDPHNKMLRDDESATLRDYDKAIKEEEKLYSRNRVNVVHDEEGKKFEGDQVAQQFVKHFQKFLGESVPVHKLQGCHELFKKKLSKEDAEFMVKEVSNAKIRKAMFMIDDNKAPGPDGYSSHFFKKAWHIIGEDVCTAVREFFVTGRILSEINSTIIALVPKIQTPAKVFDYRPIACCNVIYKCISKVITERIKKFLGKLVSQNQSAFIPNRQIQDNILISQELLKGYGRKNGPKRVALKIDL
ncbi:RNA-directed DNA polymerase, eukaryota, reverse transcriptase zinc-binding domain protein [Tanacetum coccineum]|uniref:RNA-directed DNA polymerase, eukaryota, reverse transcriptase zinc-binding domain protein n=1 Tax=Tanacetum coccineum TaxID=301880 RepID=A0ABQ5DIL2_9ASTR